MSDQRLTLDDINREFPPPSTPAAAGPAAAPARPANRWAEGALASVLREFASAGVGGRNDALNRAAFALGQIVGGGHLDRGRVEAALTEAAMVAGLGERETRATIASGVTDGMEKPRHPTERNGHPGQGVHAPRSDSISVPPYKGAEVKSNPEGFPSPKHVSLLERPPGARWVWEGFLARGGVTLLSALWKAGKTTLLSHLLRAMEAGGEFCGKPLAAGRVLYVTEEAEGLWADRRDELPLAGQLYVLSRPFGNGRADYLRWADFLTHLGGWLKENPADLVVLDTLSNLWPVKDENDAAGVQAALVPLHQLTKQAALLLVHHNRKGDGQQATASRGSGALPAFVDIIVELRRLNPDDNEDRKRVLSGYGRYKETPTELVIELSPEGYVAHGTRGQVAARGLVDIIATLLPTHPPGMTSAQVIDAWPEDEKPRNARLLASLTWGTDNGRWHRDGEGKRGSPFRFWLCKDSISVPPYKGAEVKSNLETDDSVMIG